VRGIDQGQRQPEALYAPGAAAANAVARRVKAALKQERGKRDAGDLGALPGGMLTPREHVFGDDSADILTKREHGTPRRNQHTRAEINNV
jgi:hypothetical protein